MVVDTLENLEKYASLNPLFAPVSYTHLDVYKRQCSGRRKYRYRSDISYEYT